MTSAQGEHGPESGGPAPFVLSIEAIGRLVDALPGAIVVMNCEGPHDHLPRIVHCNEAFYWLTGHDREGVAGRDITTLAAPADLRSLIDLAETARLSGRPARRELLIACKNGEALRSRVDLVPLAAPEGHCVYLVATCSPEAAPPQSDGREAAAYRQLFEHNPIPMWIYDLETLRFLAVNDTAVRKYGWTREQFLGMSILDIRPAEERQAVATSAHAPRHALKESGPWRHRLADGSLIHIQLFSHAFTFAGREAILAAAWDITSAIQARRELAESEQRLRRTSEELRRQTQTLLSAQRMAKLGTWGCDAAGDSLRWSDEIYEMFGIERPQSETELRWPLDLVHADDREDFHERLVAARAGIEPGIFDFRIVRTDGSVCHCRMDGRFVLDEDGTLIGLYGICQDVTEAKQAEALLVRSERLKTLGQLTGGIAHDFNNLLTVISINLELAEQAPSHDLLERFVGTARRATDKAARLTDQLLSFARRQPLRPEPILVKPFLTGFVEMLERMLGERYVLRQLHGSEAAACVADPARLETALLNLVMNARDSMPAGGEIVIETGIVRFAGGGPFDQEDLQPGRYVRIAVSDFGHGMAPDLIKRAFEPFFTTKGVGEGTGLGLAMVYGFAKQSGGHATIYSEAGRGTTAKIYLPATDAADPAGAPGVRDLVDALPPLPPLEVLVVEDRADVLVSVCLMLADLGLRPTPAPTAGEAIRLLDGEQTFDLLFTDVVLGGAVSGADLADRCRERRPDIKVLLTSGYTAGVFRPSAGQLERYELLVKPYTRLELAEAIAATLATAASSAG